MKYLLTGAAALVLLTACGKKDKDAIDPTPAGVEFSNGKIPSVKVRKGDAGSAGDVLSALSLNDAAGGRITFDKKDVSGTKATFTNVTLISADESDDSIDAGDDEDDFSLKGADLKAGKLEFEGLGMIDGKANFGRMLLTDIAFVPKDPDEAKDGSAKIKSIELVNPSAETAAWVASLFGKGEPVDMPEGDALAFDRWGMDDLSFKIDEDGGDKGNFLIDAVEIVGMHQSKAAQIALKDMTFNMVSSESQDNMSMKIGSMDLRGADFALLAGRGENASEGGMSAGMVKMMQNDPTNPGFDLFTLTGMTADMAGAKVDLPKVVSKVGRDKQGRAVKVKTEPFKMTIDTGEGEFGEKLGAQLATLGYEKLVISGESDSVYDPETDLITLVKGKNYWALDDGFRLDFSAKYAGAAAMAKAQATDKPGSSNADNLIEDAMDSMVLHNVEIALDDNGFFNRAFSAYATQAGKDPAQLRQELTAMSAMAPMMAPSIGIDTALATEAVTALTGFLNDPKTLTIKLAPETPLRVSELANLEDPSKLTKNSLGFSASNK